MEPPKEFNTSKSCILPKRPCLIYNLNTCSNEIAERDFNPFKTMSQNRIQPKRSSWKTRSNEMAGIDFNPIFKVDVYEAGFFPQVNKPGLYGMEKSILLASQLAI